MPYLDIIKGIWGEKLFAAAARPPSCHIQSLKEKRGQDQFCVISFSDVAKNHFCSIVKGKIVCSDASLNSRSILGGKVLFGNSCNHVSL